MKSIHSKIKVGLVCALTVLFLSCKKEKVDPVPSIWNYVSFTDVRDGKTYKSIKIGNQEWMAENLAYSISGSWNYWGDEKIGAQYGRLYTWEAAKLAVPDGWHLPTDDEWKQLEMALGMNQMNANGIDGRGTNEGGKLKTITGWADKRNGTDEVGFAAQPGGYRTSYGNFVSSEWYGYWWTATEIDNTTAWFRYLGSGSGVFRNFSYKGEGYSVRCIKN